MNTTYRAARGSSSGTATTSDLLGMFAAEFAGGERTADPARWDAARPIAIVDDRNHFLAWSASSSVPPDVRVTTRYILAVELDKILCIEPLTASDVASTSQGEATSLASRFRASMLAPRTTPPLPRTPLGRRLLELRQKIVASGAPLLDWEGLERELAQRRGERDQERSG